SRPVRIVCGYPPGGVVDIYARLIAQWLSERLGQQFIVENKPGAGGTIAAETVVRAVPDGHALLLATSADAWNTTLYDNLKFNFARGVAAVAPISRGPGVLVLHPSLPPKSVPELIAYAKSNPGKVTVASAGIGSAPQCDRCRNVARTLSWRRAGAHRPPWRPGPGVFRHLGVNDRIRQDGKAARVGGNQRDARRGVA